MTDVERRGRPWTAHQRWLMAAKADGKHALCRDCNEPLPLRAHPSGKCRVCRRDDARYSA